MTNDEIRALADEARADIAFCEEHIKSLPMYDFKMTMRLTSTIETLLAREVEVIELLTQNATFGNIPKSPGVLLNQAHTILNPQPAVIAKEKTND